MDRNESFRKEDKSSELLFGRHPIIDALENGRTIEKVLLSNTIHGDFEKRLRYLCKEANIPLQVVPKERLNSISRKNHQGVIAFVSPIPFYELEDILPSDLAQFMDEDDEVTHLNYPVLEYPKKVKSINLDKTPHFSKKLIGIKGQYFMFEDETVINIRKYTGYNVSINV